MTQVKIYSKDYCPYCVHAKRLLEGKGVNFEEINLESDPDKMQKLIQQTGMRTVPQIFIGETFVGGFSELSELEKKGELDSLLGL